MKQAIHLFIIVIAFALLQSCAQDEFLERSSSNQETVITTRSANNSVSYVPDVSFFSLKDIPGILRGWMDPKDEIFDGIDRDKYTITTLSEEGYNLVYVVNFDDGGWVLVSAIMLENGPILGFSGKGFVTQFFDPYNLIPPVQYLIDSYKKHILGKIKQSRDNRLTSSR